MTKRDVETILNQIGQEPVPLEAQRLADELTQQFAGNLPSRRIPKWRHVMKTRLFRCSAAAVLVMAAAISIHHFGGSVDISTIALADISEAMKKTSWMHIKHYGLEGINCPSESWIGFDSNWHANKNDKGNIILLDFKNSKWYEYDSEKKNLTIRYLSAKDTYCPLDMSSPYMFLDSMFNNFKEKGAEITVKEILYSGRKAFLQEFTTDSGEPANEKHNFKLYVQPNTNLVLAAQVRVTDAQGNVVRDSETTFSYPEKGPESIYDLGVPADTKVINLYPAEEFLAVWNRYEQCREAATEEYLAVITHVSSPLRNTINMVDVDRKSDIRRRLERHFVFQRGEGIEQSWPKYQAQLGDSLESLMAWTHDHFRKTGHISVYLYDGQYNMSAIRDDQNRWTNYRKIPAAPSVSMMPNIDLASLAWPRIGPDGHLFENEYSRENSLICIERLQQGIVDSNIVSHPARFLYYLDPQKNYMCLRKVTEWRPDAEWQRDKDWLKDVDPKIIPNGSITVQDITEVIQDTNGYWYPKTMEEKQTGIRKDYRNTPLQTLTIKKVYLQTRPKFPDGTFEFTVPEGATVIDEREKSMDENP